MGAIKSNGYSSEELEFSKLGRAFAHPARRRIIELLLEGGYYINTDLSAILNLSQPTVKAHLDQLLEAGIIETQYFMHHYRLKLKVEGFEPLKAFIQLIEDSEKF